jgi:hypothetical protein
MKKIVFVSIILINVLSLNFNLNGNKEFCMRFQGGNTYGL